MLKGTIMFFSSEGTVAHIWCSEGDNPLFLATAAMFPHLWPDLSVGSVVAVEGRSEGRMQSVTRLELVTTEA